MSQAEQIKEITEKLQQGIENLFNSDSYKLFLKTMSKFHSYSLNNTLLIYMQKPDAVTPIAGFSTWKQMNRNIKKGSKAIKILAPIIYKKKDIADITDTADKNTIDKNDKDIPESEKVLVGFKIVNVFDYNSTDGPEPLPEIAHKLDGTVDNYNDFMDALMQFSPSQISFENIEGSANGYYHLVNKNIVIDDGMSQMMNCKTAIHEITHALLHDQDTGSDKDADKQTKEVQAESVAFTVCQYYGIDTSDYSFGYVAGWSSGKNLEELKASLQTIRQTAQTIITGIDQKLDAIRQAKQMDMDVSISKNMDAPTKSEPTHNKHLKH